MTETQKIPRREEIPVEYTWDLSTVYPSDDAWEQDVIQLEQQLPGVQAIQGTIGQGPQQLLRALQVRDEIIMRLWQIFAYANRRHDSDTSQPKGQMLAERAGSLASHVYMALAFIDPEILAIEPETLVAWQAEEPGLQVYAYALEDLVRQRPHVRSAEVEQVIAAFSDVTRAPSDIYEILTNADLKFPSIEDEQGRMVELSHARYVRLRESRDRRVRHDAFQGLIGTFAQFRNAIGTSLAAEVRSHVVSARLRGYRSTLESALDQNDIPVAVYHNLVTTINANLPRLSRYMRIRRKLLGLDELHVYDLYAPLVHEVDITVDYAEAVQTVRAALAPLGPTYGHALEAAFTSRWIDVYENVGKRSGAYSDGSYTTAPFILLNYQNRLNDVFTLAHELGHSMHSYFTRRSQPFIYGNYTIFLAEVASTLNEAMLTAHLLQTRSDPLLRKHLIVQQLEDIRTTIFRQTMFAEFELLIHDRTEAGEPLTADTISKLYYEIVERYYGAEVILDDMIAYEWAWVPHLFYRFYVYQYATGLSAALALHKRIANEGQPAVDRYLRFLSSGSSRPSIELLRDAGVDMTTPEPIQSAMERFDQLLEQLEAIS